MGEKPAPSIVSVDNSMDRAFVFEIRVEGHLTDRWSGWFEGLAIRNEPNHEATLVGLLQDQAALLGVLNKIHGLNLTLISVVRSPHQNIN
jgi:hypothetical protein